MYLNRLFALKGWGVSKFDIYIEGILVRFLHGFMASNNQLDSVYLVQVLSDKQAGVVVPSQSSHYSSKRQCK